MDNVVEMTAAVGYQEFKQALDTELQKTAESFVRIGYMLRLAQETEILAESGYADVYEFADKEYHLDRSQVSRFVNINKKFSEGGFSDSLQDKYHGFGYAKLSVMLQLPDVVIAELSPEFSKTEIQAVHEEVKEEAKVSDVEVWLEGEAQEQAVMENNLQKAMHQLCHDKPDEVYRGLFSRYLPENQGETIRSFQELLAPAGEAIHMVRVQGVGRLMISVKGADQPVSLVNVRSNESEKYSWEELVGTFAVLVKADSWKESWEKVYGESLSEEQKKEIAPVQPKRAAKNESPKQEPRKQPKVQKAVTKPKQASNAQKSPESVHEPEKKESAEILAQESEPKIEAQMVIEDYPEVLPDGYQRSKTDEEKDSQQGDIDMWDFIKVNIDTLQSEMGISEDHRSIDHMIHLCDEIKRQLEEIKGK
jgi:hypothetical protein